MADDDVEVSYVDETGSEVTGEVEEKPFDDGLDDEPDDTADDVDTGGDDESAGNDDELEADESKDEPDSGVDLDETVDSDTQPHSDDTGEGTSDDGYSDPQPFAEMDTSTPYAPQETDTEKTLQKKHNIDADTVEKYDVGIIDVPTLNIEDIARRYNTSVPAGNDSDDSDTDNGSDVVTDDESEVAVDDTPSDVDTDDTPGDNTSGPDVDDHEPVDTTQRGFDVYDFMDQWNQLGRDEKIQFYGFARLVPLDDMRAREALRVGDTDKLADMRERLDAAERDKVGLIGQLHTYSGELERLHSELHSLQSKNNELRDAVSYLEKEAEGN